MAAPTTPIDWSTFSGFNGSLKRATLVDDSPILDPGQPVHESGDNKSVNVGRDVLKWKAWISRLRDADATERQATFGQFANDAKLVIDKFFPKDTAPIRVRAKIDKSQEPVADPLLVQFGASDPLETLELVDGPSALAYLFSIATPVAQPTWQNYYLPMLVLLSKCLYLAFIGNEGDETTRITGVPFMSCVTFVETENRKYNRYIFGSTFAVGPGSDAAASVMQMKHQILMDNWRRELMNRILHKETSIVFPTFPRFPFTPLSPKYHRQLCSDLFVRLVNTGNIAKAAIAAFSAVSVAQRFEMSQKKILFDFIPQEDLFAIYKYRTAIEESLKKVIMDRFDLGYEPHSTDLPVILSDFVKLFLVPRLLQPRKLPSKGKLELDSPLDEPDSPPYLAVKEAALRSFWLAANNSVQEVVDSLYTAITYNTVRPQGSTWGRCAETYCFSGMLYQWWPDIANQVKMSNVTGFALQTRAIGLSDLKPFDTKTLGQIKGEVAGVYRLPCEDCTALMPVFEINAKEYNKTVNAIPDQTEKLK